MPLEVFYSKWFWSIAAQTRSMSSLQDALLVAILAALTAAQGYAAIDVISALSGQSQLTNFTTYLGLFPTLVTQIDAGNVTGTVTL